MAGKFLDAVEERSNGGVQLIAGGDDLVGEGAFEVGVLFWANSAVDFSVSADQRLFVGRAGLEPATNGL
ncbi:hypothetical protein AB0B25_26420 [Nocardia sp. NPDC049190]|uniref:hypothetical protein n=1 Tax=Nocardia sp. NPDC049190 TaxID=3155650 RepID=UPI0033F2A63D